MNFGEMKRKCESKGLGFARFSREAVEGLLERTRRALARPLASLVPPPPYVITALQSASTWQFQAFGRNVCFL